MRGHSSLPNLPDRQSANETSVSLRGRIVCDQISSTYVCVCVWGESYRSVDQWQEHTFLDRSLHRRRGDEKKREDSRHHMRAAVTGLIPVGHLSC